VLFEESLMKTASVALIAAAGTTLALAAACYSTSSRDRQVARGQYLVTVGGCNDCHTPLKMGPAGPEPDMSRMLSGHPSSFKIESAPAAVSPQWMMIADATGTAFSGPWGVSFTANLTPDTNTGTGIWTEDMFIKTLRTGKHWGTSRDILPPMPWFNYGKMTDDDLKAVFAYLRTIPPVHNQVPEPLAPSAALAPPTVSSSGTN
jgi:mono/diheme cytochrome c family protein